jgi:hypothetical protein
MHGCNVWRSYPNGDQRTAKAINVTESSNMQSEMKGCSAPNSHRMRPSVRMGLASGLRGRAQRLAQEIFT